VTDSEGVVVKRVDVVPYGETLLAGVGLRTTDLKYESSEDANNPRQRFTGKERDAETNLDYFGARYMGAAQGRFTSPDPLGTILADVTDPQTWNQYAYVRNNPMRFIDPTGYGHCQPASGAKAGQDAGSPEACAGAGGTWVPDAGDPQTIQNDSGETATIETPVTTMNVTPDDDDAHWWLVHLVIGGRDARSGRRGSSGASQKTSAANNGPTVSHCLGVAGRKNAVALSLDVTGVGAGFLPGGDLVVAGAQATISVASGVNSAAHGDNVGAALGVLGLPATFTSYAAKAMSIGGKALPAVGALVSAAGALNDAYGTYQDYQSCMAGH
jgi:RHS repeat-associated protein